jgi:hypothetical protein
MTLWKEVAMKEDKQGNYAYITHKQYNTGEEYFSITWVKAAYHFTVPHSSYATLEEAKAALESLNISNY